MGITRLRRHWPLAGPLALAAVLNSWALATVGWGNTYYSAAVRSMSESWHAFIFGSFDRNGFVTVDKPPLSLWVGAVFVKVFGYHQLTLLVPQVLAGCGAVVLVYATVVHRWGRLAAVVGATALAVSPISVMVHHSNNTDAILTFAMTATVAAGVRAAETGRLRWWVTAAVLFGASFTTKMLAAFPVLPAVLLAFALAAPLAWRRRGPALAGGAALAVVVALAWFAFVDVTPKADRPYVGSSPTNSAFQLAFDRNGLGQVEGEMGGGGPGGAPGQRPNGPSNGPADDGQRPYPPMVGDDGPTGPAGPPPADLPYPPVGQGQVPVGQGQVPGGQGDGAPDRPGGGPVGPAGAQVPGGGFSGGEPGVLRLFNADLGTQIGWLILPAGFALVGAVVALGWRRSLRTPSLVAPVVWFGVGAAGYSVTKGIVHPYYVASIAPPLAMVVGIGAGVLRMRGGRRAWWIAAGPAVAATGFVQWVISRRTGYDTTTVVTLVAVAAGIGLAVAAAVRPGRLGRVAAGIAVGAVLLAPAAWTAGSLKAGVSGTMPYASATSRTGPGPGGFSGSTSLVEYLEANRGDADWLVATPSAMVAAPIIIETGDAVMAMGGFSGGDPILDVDEFDALVESGSLRFVLLGYAGQQAQGANSPIAAHVRSSCSVVDLSGAQLYDCAPAN